MAGLTKTWPRPFGPLVALPIQASIGPQPEYFTEIVLANLG